MMGWPYTTRRIQRKGSLRKQMARRLALNDRLALIRRMKVQSPETISQETHAMIISLTIFIPLALTYRSDDFWCEHTLPWGYG